MAQPSRLPRSYQLSSALVASSVGAGVLCLADPGMGRTYRLHAARPDARLNRPIVRADIGADLPSGAAHVITPVAPQLTRVDISGPLEQRAGYHDPCAGWTDGHDAIADRLCEAFASGDVFLVADTPGGAAEGIQQAVGRALRAKALYGRRVTVWADEMIGSAGVWWTHALGDEIFLPPLGRIGSIGARAAHLDVSGAMAKAGEVLTYFSDPPEKVALAAEFPLGDVGRARGTRDVKIIADAFRAAVCDGPLGARGGVTPEQLIALGADMLTGSAAVAAGLADGVATFEEVAAYALSLAEMGPVKAPKDSAREARARGKGTMRTRAEDDKEARARVEEDDKGPPSSKPGDEPKADEGREIPTKCAKCDVENKPEAKFCMGCGSNMSTAEPEASEDEPAASSKPIPPGSSARSLSTSADLCEILGLPPGSSVPAQKARALEWRRVMSKVGAMTGRTDADEMVGALMLVEKDAANAPRYRSERNKLREEGETRDRFALAHRLVAAGEDRARVFVDVVGTAGKRTGIKLADEVSELRIKTLRAKVEGLEARKAPTNPFEPDRARAAALAGDVARTGGLDKATRIKAAEKDPTVIKMYENEKIQGGKVTLADVAAQWIETLDGGAK